MGCGASAKSEEKYTPEKDSTATGGQKDANVIKPQPTSAEATKPITAQVVTAPAATKQELPPEKPPEVAKQSEEVKSLPPQVESPPPPAKTPPPAAEEKPVDEEKEADGRASEAPPEESPDGDVMGVAVEAGQHSPIAGVDGPAASENAMSLAADVVVAEAEAALAESSPPRDEAASDSQYLYEEDPEFPTLRGERMMTASALLEVDRSSGASLGICVRAAETVLLITKVEEEGLIPAWNLEHTERPVHAGSRVIQVNGYCGAAEQLLEELQKPVALRIEVDRTDREVKASLTNAGMAHWCREMIQQIYERHDEAGLKTLDRRMNTYKDRELALYRTLSKKFGEEPKDPELCHNAVEDIVL